MHDDQSITVFKALADTTRLKLVKQLASCPTGKKSCGELSTKSYLSQPAMSHHFAKLVQAGVVQEIKEGTQKYYELNGSLLAKCGIDVAKLKVL